MFFVPSFREVCDSTGNSAKDFLLQDSLCHAPSLASWMIDGFVLALGWAVILLVLWRLILYIAGVDRKK